MPSQQSPQDKPLINEQNTNTFLNPTQRTTFTCLELQRKAVNGDCLRFVNVNKKKIQVYDSKMLRFPPFIERDIRWRV
jgi:hypothetical protein